MPVKIHNKDYFTVAERVAKFREDFPECAITTEIIAEHGETIVMKATISDGQNVLATGHAEENRSASQINQVAALEVCETSAVGRALAFFHYAGTEIASADEVANAIKQQHEKEMYAQWTLHTQTIEEWHDTLTAIRQFLADKQWEAAREAWHEVDHDAQRVIWRATTKGGWFTTKERDQMKHFPELIRGDRDE